LHEIENQIISLRDNKDCNHIDEVLCITIIYVTKWHWSTYIHCAYVWHTETWRGQFSYDCIVQYFFSVFLKHLVQDSVKVPTRTSQTFGLSLDIKSYFPAA